MVLNESFSSSCVSLYDVETKLKRRDLLTLGGVAFSSTEVRIPSRRAHDSDDDNLPSRLPAKRMEELWRAMVEITLATVQGNLERDDQRHSGGGTPLDGTADGAGGRRR